MPVLKFIGTLPCSDTSKLRQKTQPCGHKYKLYHYLIQTIPSYLPNIHQTFSGEYQEDLIFTRKCLLEPLMDPPE